VLRISAIRSPVLRNLEITYAYSLLAAEVAARAGSGANWCSYATWASRQAGRTIRGEDAIGYVQDRLGQGRDLLHPVQSFGRWLLRRGLFNPGSRLGRLMKRLHTPFDAVELASDAVVRGNLKVFEEIALVFARWLADETTENEAPLLRSAFDAYATADGDEEPLLFANLQIGLHEQTRLQPEICEALDAPYVTADELGRCLCGTTRPRLARLVGTVARPVQGWMAELAREAITHSLMVLAMPGRTLSLGTNLPDPVARDFASAELAQLVARFEPVEGVDDCGARDWSSLEERMHYISHLFRAWHARRELADPPFTPAQVESFQAGVIPEGDL
jgi:hypothetical protein